MDGGLLLELYTRDGVGTMISADFYEGVRRCGQGMWGRMEHHWRLQLTELSAFFW